MVGVPTPNISSSSSAAQDLGVDGPDFGIMPVSSAAPGSVGDNPLLWIAAMTVAGVVAYFALKR